MSSASPDRDPPPPVAAALATAAERRAHESPAAPGAAQRLREHERRQAFRRLVDPGITRPNPRDAAAAALKTLHALAHNLLREPDNSKFQQFKATNHTIKRTLIDPKGALEYAIALGFRPEVENFQPVYRFNPRKLDDLRIGAAILDEILLHADEKQVRIARAQEEEKERAASTAERVKLAFLDDRKTKEMNDQIERERRAAHEAAAAERARHAPADSASPARSPTLPNTGGHTLAPIDTDEVETDESDD